MSQQLAIDFNKVATIPTEKVNRTVRFRLLPGTWSKGKKLAETAGAARKLWNELLGGSKDEWKAYQKAKESGGKAKKPSVSFFTFCNKYLEIKARLPWMKAYSSCIRQSAARALSVSYSNFFKGQGRFPRFKKRRGDDSFCFGIGNGEKKQRERIDNNVVFVPKIGEMALRRRGGNPYKGCCPKTVRIKKELRKWYAYICYEVTIPKVMDKDLKTAIGIDMNVANQCALSNGDMVVVEDLKKYEGRKNRYKRRFTKRQKKGSKRQARTIAKLAKTERKIKNIRDTHNHTISHRIAKNAAVVVVEDLNVKGMTAKAKGKGKTQKSGLNKGILKNAWGDLRRKLEYKANRLQAVNPAYTSQACSECGHVAKSNRKSQSQFHCNECGHKENADVNAAKNVLFLGMKEITASVSGASGRARGVPEVEDPNDPSIDIFGSKLIPISHRFL